MCCVFIFVLFTLYSCINIAVNMLIHNHNFGGDSILQHRSKQFIQRGNGIGNIFSSLARWLVPAAKKVIKTVGSVGKKIISNPTVQHVANTAKNEAIRVATDMAANAIAGESVSETVPESIQKARTKIANAMRRVRPVEDDDSEYVDEKNVRQNGSGCRKRRKVEYDDIFTI